MMRAIRSLCIATALLFPVADGSPQRHGEIMEKMSLDTARTMVNEIYEALTTPEAKAAIDAVAPKTDDGGMKMRLTVVLPVADELTKAVREKFGFTGELQDAMEAAGRTGQDALDKKMEEAIQSVSEVIVGETSPRRVGRVARLDALADGFVALDAEGRKEAMQTAQAVLDGLGDQATSPEGPAAGAPTYIDIMRGVIEHGDDYPIQQVIDNVVLLGPDVDEDGAKTTDPARKAIHIKLNVIAEFLSMADHEKVGERVEAAMKEAMEAKEEAKTEAAKTEAAPQGDAGKDEL